MTDPVVEAVAKAMLQDRVPGSVWLGDHNKQMRAFYRGCARVAVEALVPEYRAVITAARVWIDEAAAAGNRAAPPLLRRIDKVLGPKQKQLKLRARR